MPSQLIGILIALSAAVSWGGADFSGGYAARKLNQFRVLFLTSFGSLFLLILLAILWGETLPSLRSIILALLAGTAGALGLSLLYKGLSTGNSAIVASVSGVIGAIIPVLVGIVLQGVPKPTQAAGFVLALLGIWLVTRFGDSSNGDIKGSLTISVLAGLGFGGFLTLIAQVDSDQLFSPLVVSKFASLMVAFVIIRSSKQSVPRPFSSPVAFVSGLLDAGGNLFYLWSTHYTRLDVAVILSSLYPAGTILLSMLVFKEKVNPKQWIGVIACLMAIGLIVA